MRFFPLVLVLAAVTSATSAATVASHTVGDILHELKAFAQTGRVLYVAAHPDDENTRLIAYLARGRGYKTGYLSLTRGDGGQNLIGPELRDALGVIRTQELLAARRIDGGVQFFTRANDFGFSKTPEETLSVWGRDEILKDMIRVIRTFQPDVIITRFPPEAGGTHGHHTASAQLAIEAHRLAADPSAYADELGQLAPWQARRVVWNAWTWRGGVSTEGLLPLNAGAYDTLLGESYGEIAARSRTMHKSQGFGTVGSRGPAREHFRHLAGEAATDDIMDGIDTSWARFPGGEAVGRQMADVIATFSPMDPSASVPALAAIHRSLEQLTPSPILAEKRRQLDRIIAACLGLHVRTTVAQAEVVPGEQIELRHTAIVRAPVAVKWRVGGREIDLSLNEVSQHGTTETLPEDTPLTHPYWLRGDSSPGLFAVADPALIGRPENPPVLSIEQVFVIAGVTLRLATEPVQVIDDPVRGEVLIPLRVIAPLAVAFPEDLELMQPGATRRIAVDLIAHRPGLSGTLTLEAPEGWRLKPSSQPFALQSAGERTRLNFEIAAPDRPSTGIVHAAAQIEGRTYRQRRVDIRYEHIPPQLLQPDATLKAVSLDVATSARRIGYIPGAGDLIPDALRHLGCSVTTIDPEALTPARLEGLDAVVLGIRALNTQPALAARMRLLFRYAEDGGTVVMQYNTTGGLPDRDLAPYPLRLSRERVTEEDARVTFLAPEHPALTGPNRITPEDFDGWVQERGLYFAGDWDEHFVPLISAADRGEPQREGSLLVARHGKGWFVYTGLSFFRELPEGVPGAYRLFANLISLGHGEVDGTTNEH